MLENGEDTAGVVRTLEFPAQRRLALTRRPAQPKKRPPLSPQAALREVLAQFATGVTVITAGAGRNCHGMTANAFTSVSLEPPLVLCCVARAARMHEVILSANSFAISILGADQQAAAKHFADWRRPDGEAQFDAVRWDKGQRTGAPLLAGALAWLECELVKVHDGGDHSIFIGEVLSANRDPDAEGSEAGEQGALLFHGGSFHHLLVENKKTA